MAKLELKELAIALRKQGKTYNEILTTVPVAKSTLSLWLRDVGLARVQQHRITKRKRAAQLKGAAVRREDRLVRTESIVLAAKKEVGTISNRELLLIGAALYWAEGAKEKPHNTCVQLMFANSDPAMVKLYMRWLRDILDISDADIIVTVHLHQNKLHQLASVTQYWASMVNLPLQSFGKPVIKKHNPKTNRKNISDSYRGLVAIRVKRSTMLTRKIHGFILGIVESAT
jgi:hypothetical protein